jgi:isoamylase
MTLRNRKDAHGSTQVSHLGLALALALAVATGCEAPAPEPQAPAEPLELDDSLAIAARGLGASYTPDRTSVRFRVYSSSATRVELSVFAQPFGAPEAATFVLTRIRRTSGPRSCRCRR